jgi:phosphatidylserine decarboxylase
MPTPLRMALSRAVGWAADRKIPTFLRAPVYRTYARFTGADLSEVLLPLALHPSLGAFFVRRLKEGARPIPSDRSLLLSPVDGTVQTACPIERGQIHQAKGRPYALSELLCGLFSDIDLEGGFAWTIYLSPRDYHRIHSPDECRVTHAEWFPGCRYSVAPGVLDRRQVLPINERAALRLETDRGPLLLVLVGATNVGRIRVVGIEPTHEGPVEPPKPFARGAELARFEMGSTIVLIAPPGKIEPRRDLAPGMTVKLGEPIGTWRARARATSPR